MNRSHYVYPRSIYLMLPCTQGERILESDVHLTNIEEDIQGRDVVTFDCPRCGHEHRSLRFNN